MRVGPLEIGSISDWTPVDGPVVLWQPTAASLAKAAKAPLSSVPVGYMQAQHIRGYCSQRDLGLDYSRLMVVSCDAPGVCDVRAMTYVVNNHLRRHDTYRSWFEYDGTGEIIRHAIDNPADIDFSPVKLGEMEIDKLRDLVANIPDPLNWDCFRYGIVQGPESFTFFAAIDHVHVDAMIVGVTLMEFFMMYSSLVAGGAPLELPPAGKYADFCERQYAYTGALTAESPEVREWVEFAKANHNTLPTFPLPLGDPTVRWGSAIETMTVMDQEQMVRFEASCTEAGARFIGGVFACIGLTEHHLTGADFYYAVTPKDTRRDFADSMTQGWFTGLIPVTVPIGGESFADSARAAQVSFDNARSMAELPYDRVIELDPTLSSPPPNFPVINFLDAGTAPLSALLTAELGDLHVGVYSDGRYSYQLSIYVARVEDQTAVSVMYPDNPEAKESVHRFLGALKSVFELVAERGHWRDVALDLAPGVV
jgi:hypothetical protein